ncbi:MAG TPA: aminotransferase class V-fold PLP-dependent enzyme [Mycobacteriales bacterium]|nr:aminotransferase class V-fold PLP-dependent enzyme [Mycobacteriales bacterium]
MSAATGPPSPRRDPAPGSGYFDAATAAPLHPAARMALQAAVDDGWADPDRLYRAGRRARLLLETAREAVAAALGARPDEISFCSSGTTAAHLAVLGALLARQRTGRHLVVSAVEHSAVLAAARWHADGGGELTTVGVDRTGRVDPAAYAAALRADTALASLQSANHEVGTLQPVAEVAATCRERGVPLHVDAAQSVGRVPLPGGWDLLTASARKWGGPAGVGVLAVRAGTRWRSPLPEDEHEGGRAPGTLSLPLVLAAAAALQARADEQAAEAERSSVLVERIRREVPRRVPDVELLGDAERRLPHLVAFSCLYVAGEALLTELDRAGFSVSSGSSCSASALTPSHVLEAMGVLTHGNVRLSLHAGVTEADVARFLDLLPPIVDRLRRVAGAQDL